MTEETISPYEVEEGDTVVMYWSPYMWAMDEHGFSSPAVCKVTDTSGTPQSGHMWAVGLKSADGKSMTANIDNGYVTSGIGGSPFDKGRFRRFTDVSEVEQEVIDRLHD